MAGPDITAILRRNEELKALKQPWLPLYQALAMYFLLRKQYFTIDSLKSPFMLNHVFDSTAGHAAHMTAASLIGQIMPNPYESFEFTPQVAQQESAYGATFDFFQTVNEVMPGSLSMPEAGLMNALQECILDMVIFGIGSIVVEETDSFSTPVRYYSADAKAMSIDENQYGEVDTVYIEKEFTVVKCVDKFGFENCSPLVQSKYDSKHWDEKVKVLHAIEPRRKRNPMKLGSLDMPWASIHVEIDSRHLLKESGYKEMPVIVSRFWKNTNEMQGRSPAMDALPDTRAVNKLVEMFEKAGEMGLDPPKMISSEDVLGAGKIPWGPGVDIPIHNNGRLSQGGRNSPPIEPIITVQNPSWAIQRIQDLRAQIKQALLTEALTDPLGTYRKTLGEAHLENERNTFAVGPILNRCLVELLGPALDRSFDILLGKGFFGVIQGSVTDVKMQMMGMRPKYLSQDFISQRMSGFKGYRINFISPAARLMKTEEAQGADALLVATTSMMQIQPTAGDMINGDEYVKTQQRLRGASSKLINSPQQVAQIRKARSQQQDQAQKLQTGLALAKMAKEGGAGFSDIAGTQQQGQGAQAS